MLHTFFCPAEPVTSLIHAHCLQHDVTYINFIFGEGSSLWITKILYHAHWPIFSTSPDLSSIEFTTSTEYFFSLSFLGTRQPPPPLFLHFPLRPWNPVTISGVYSIDLLVFLYCQRKLSSSVLETFFNIPYVIFYFIIIIIINCGRRVQETIITRACLCVSVHQNKLFYFYSSSLVLPSRLLENNWQPNTGAQSPSWVAPLSRYNAHGYWLLSAAAKRYQQTFLITNIYYWHKIKKNKLVGTCSTYRW